jgi:hypothetical protein
MGLMLVVLVLRPWPFLVGYWLGASMHMIFDVLINGEYALRRAVLFYFFTYRASRGFAADQLMDRIVLPADTGKRPIIEFFKWRPTVGKERPAKQAASARSASSA